MPQPKGTVGYTDLDPTFPGNITDDVVILIVGDSGVGKSYFVNRFLMAIGSKKRVLEGERLAGCTLRIDPVVIEEQDWMKRYIHISIDSNPTRIILVDTPGLDTSPSALQRVADWLRRSYPSYNPNSTMIVAGVIYLHDISRDRISKTTHPNLQVLSGMLRESLTSSSVVLVTTKWGRPGGPFDAREEELMSKHWAGLLKPRNEEEGATVKRFSVGSLAEEQEMALAIVHPILKKVDCFLGKGLSDYFHEFQDYIRGKRAKTEGFTQELADAIEQGLETQRQISAAGARLENGEVVSEVERKQLQRNQTQSFIVVGALLQQLSTWDKFSILLQSLSPRFFRGLFKT